ncbi:MAG: adenosylcobinamide amidohydrolase [Anaerolineae bacterium]
MIELDFPGATAKITPHVLVLRSEHPLHVLSSAVVNGGLTRTRYIINHHVDKSYGHSDPVNDLRNFASGNGVDEPFVGLMTAVRLHRARAVTHRAGDLTVAVVVTAGLSNATAAGLSRPATLTSGTINLTLLIDARLTPAAMVNAVVTATEAKTHVLLARGVRTPEGQPATGTSTDAVVVACTERGEPLPYAGPATRVGWLIGQCVRHVLEEALE